MQHHVEHEKLIACEHIKYNLHWNWDYYHLHLGMDHSLGKKKISLQPTLEALTFQRISKCRELVSSKPHFMQGKKTSKLV